MEIPDLDELQWLEACSNVQEEVGQEDDDYIVEDEVQVIEEEGGSCRPEPEGKDAYEEEGRLHLFESNNNNSKKRPRSHSLDLEASKLVADPDLDQDIRVRVKVQDKYNEEDDWLRLPPQQHLEESHTNNNKYLSHYASEIDGDCMPITSPAGSGERVYALLHNELFTSVNNFNMLANSTGLVAEPVSSLLQKAEQDALMKALQASSEVQNDLLLPETSAVTEELWVNKYAPKSFTELLSDENTNREVLVWLKQWDSAVFGTDIRNTGDEVLSALRRHSTIPHHQKYSDTSFARRSKGPRLTEKYMGHSSKSQQEDIKSKGALGLQNKKTNGSGAPDQKVLLLCGPPGLGKTTLAHVVARHCGYHVVEINASDDRSSTTMEAKILDAMQMNSVMADSKPKCLVLDEIDGALGEGKGAVEIIVKMVTAERKSYSGKETSTMEGQSGKSSLKKGHKTVSLSRPVICICNDLYAPALRPLRLIAKVHVFAQPTVNRVVSRLKYICSKEGLKTSSIALTALAEYTECDIRSCLNTLQFLQKKKESLNLAALSCQVIGRKDMTRNVFDIWKEVFQKRKLKRNLKHDASQIKTYDAHNSLYSLVSYRGDYELILDGIHENFCQLHSHDPMLQKTVHCVDALGHSDLLRQCVMRSHNMSLNVYHPAIIITISRLLAGVERPVIEWPKSFQRHRTVLLENMEILRSWQSKVPPYISRHLSVDSFVEDSVSPLLHILSPADLRPVALHLQSDKEKCDLAQLVSTMVCYSLTYRKCDAPTQLSRHDGAVDVLSLSFDPPIHNFACFKDYKPIHYELKSAVKQVILHEVEKQKIVQEGTGRFMHHADNSRKEDNAAISIENEMPHSPKGHNTVSVVSSIERTKNMSKNINCKPRGQKSSSPLLFGGNSDMMKMSCAGHVKKPPMGSINILDRFKSLSRKGLQDVDSPAEKTTEKRDGHPLLFKFNEGFTNAVKKPVRIREFLL